MQNYHYFFNERFLNIKTKRYVFELIDAQNNVFLDTNKLSKLNKTVKQQYNIDLFIKKIDALFTLSYFNIKNEFYCFGSIRIEFLHNCMNLAKIS